MNRWFITALTLILLGVGGASMALLGFGNDELPDHASVLAPDGALNREFRTPGQMAASSRFVVQGSVAAVEEGEVVALGDGSGLEFIPRYVVLDVEEVLHARDPNAALPEQIRVNDGYWHDGEGVAREGVRWAQVGDAGIYFLTQDRAADGSLMPTYSLIDSSGRVLTQGDRAEYVHTGVWRSQGDHASAQQMRSAIASSVAAARSGAAKAVPSKVCFPSVPGDENSTPVCVEE